MIRSMTGFGRAEVQCDEWHVRVEVRSVNNKDLRLTCRLPDAFELKEWDLRKLVEQAVHRGHVHLSVTCRPRADAMAVLVDRDRLAGYVQAVKALAEGQELPVRLDLASLLRLPGALRDAGSDEELREAIWPHVERATSQAVAALVEMRRVEGQNLCAQLSAVCDEIRSLVETAEREQAGVVQAYRDRLRQRIERLLEGTDVPVTEDALAREVAFYADRSDVSEEIARLRSHLDQVGQALDGAEDPVGRRLEFLGQEMLREASTMGAKVPAGFLVEQALALRSAVEKLREQVRNVE